MDHQIKIMIVDAITNVVKSAPTRQYNYLGVTKESFDVWMKYVNSVLQIASQYTNMNLISSLNRQIQNIIFQRNNYTTTTNNIRDALLNFAKSILYL